VLPGEGYAAAAALREGGGAALGSHAPRLPPLELGAPSASDAAAHFLSNFSLGLSPSQEISPVVAVPSSTTGRGPDGGSEPLPSRELRSGGSRGAATAASPAASPREPPLPSSRSRDGEPPLPSSRSRDGERRQGHTDAPAARRAADGPSGTARGAEPVPPPRHWLAKADGTLRQAVKALYTRLVDSPLPLAQLQLPAYLLGRRSPEGFVAALSDFFLRIDGKVYGRRECSLALHTRSACTLHVLCHAKSRFNRAAYFRRGRGPAGQGAGAAAARAARGRRMAAVSASAGRAHQPGGLAER
jgi:hypothetical protein